jgi:hypothetical protein
MQAIIQRLVHQRMARQLALADDIFEACRLVREHRRQQIVALHAL